MVHALEQTHTLIKPGGWLINVNDLPVPHLLEVHSDEHVHKVGWLLNKNEYEATRSVLYAIAQVVVDGRFTLEDERSFIYKVYADNVTELLDWLDTTWSSAFMPDSTLHRLEALAHDAGQSSRIVLPMQTRMTLLKAA